MHIALLQKEEPRDHAIFVIEEKCTGFSFSASLSICSNMCFYLPLCLSVCLFISSTALGSEKATT